ncbi:MAG: M81 family metallopeptidase, partial [Planctomycetales bacterium]|nr:M81 family metallopeptidase [Planctomycetales bacterium]
MQEVSSFNPVPSTIDDFNIGHGQEWLDDRRSIDDEIGGALSVFEAEEGIEMVPTMGAKAITSGGTLQAADWASLRDDLVASLEDNSRVDAAYFCLHGAMSAEGEPDPEGHLLAEARRILGNDIPLVV